MSDVATLIPHLERRFRDRRVVFWHDPDGQYASVVDSLSLPGVTPLRVANDEYAVKYRLLQEQPDDKNDSYGECSEDFSHIDQPKRSEESVSSSIHASGA